MHFCGTKYYEVPTMDGFNSYYICHFIVLSLKNQHLTTWVTHNKGLNQAADLRVFPTSIIYLIYCFLL